MAAQCPHCGQTIERSEDYNAEKVRLKPCDHLLRIAVPAVDYPSFP